MRILTIVIQIAVLLSPARSCTQDSIYPHVFGIKDPPEDLGVPPVPFRSIDIDLNNEWVVAVGNIYYGALIDNPGDIDTGKLNETPVPMVYVLPSQRELTEALWVLHVDNKDDYNFKDLAILDDRQRVSESVEQTRSRFNGLDITGTNDVLFAVITDTKIFTFKATINSPTDRQLELVSSVTQIAPMGANVQFTSDRYVMGFRWVESLQQPLVSYVYANSMTNLQFIVGGLVDPLSPLGQHPVQAMQIDTISMLEQNLLSFPVSTKWLSVKGQDVMAICAEFFDSVNMMLKPVVAILDPESQSVKRTVFMHPMPPTQEAISVGIGFDIATYQLSGQTYLVSLSMDFALMPYQMLLNRFNYEPGDNGNASYIITYAGAGEALNQAVPLTIATSQADDSAATIMILAQLLYNEQMRIGLLQVTELGETELTVSGLMIYSQGVEGSLFQDGKIYNLNGVSTSSEILVLEFTKMHYQTLYYQNGMEALETGDGVNFLNVIHRIGSSSQCGVNTLEQMGPDSIYVTSTRYGNFLVSDSMAGFAITIKPNPDDLFLREDANPTVLEQSLIGETRLQETRWDDCFFAAIPAPTMQSADLEQSPVLQDPENFINLESGNPIFYIDYKVYTDMDGQPLREFGPQPDLFISMPLFQTGYYFEFCASPVRRVSMEVTDSENAEWAKSPTRLEDCQHDDYECLLYAQLYSITQTVTYDALSSTIYFTIESLDPQVVLYMIENPISPLNLAITIETQDQKVLAAEILLNSMKLNIDEFRNSILPSTCIQEDFTLSPSCNQSCLNSQLQNTCITDLCYFYNPYDQDVQICPSQECFEGDGHYTCSDYAMVNRMLMQRDQSQQCRKDSLGIGFCPGITTVGRCSWDTYGFYHCDDPCVSVQSPESFEMEQICYDCLYEEGLYAEIGGAYHPCADKSQNDYFSFMYGIWTLKANLCFSDEGREILCEDETIIEVDCVLGEDGSVACDVEDTENENAVSVFDLVEDYGDCSVSGAGEVSCAAAIEYNFDCMFNFAVNRWMCSDQCRGTICSNVPSGCSEEIHCDDGGMYYITDEEDKCVFTLKREKFLCPDHIREQEALKRYIEKKKLEEALKKAEEARRDWKPIAPAVIADEDVKDDAWLEEATPEVQLMDFNAKPFLVRERLSAFYSVPVVEDVSPQGDVEIRFTSPIKEVTTELLFRNLEQLGWERGRSLSSQNLQEITLLLSQSESVQMQLISSDTLYLDKKRFSWKVEELSPSSFRLQVEFEHPEFVSIGQEPDRMRIAYFNTETYLVPVNSYKAAIPDGYSTEVVLPVQKAPEDALQKTAEATLTTFVIANGFLSFVAKYSMQSVASMVGNLQIPAHLPLTQVNLANNARYVFDILIQVVQFDFLPIHEHVEIPFTETEGWNSRFEWLGYDSVNMFETLGSINFYIFAIVLQGVTVALQRLVRCRFCCKWCNSYFSAQTFSQTAMRFMLGAFLELVICNAIGFRMFYYSELWNKWDRAVVIYQFVICAAVQVFFVYSLFFMICKSKEFVVVEKAAIAERRKELLQEIREKFKAKEKQKKRKQFSSRQDSGELSIELDQIISMRSDKERTYQEKAEKARALSETDAFYCLFDGLALSRKRNMLFNVLFLVRRVLLVIVAMFLEQYGFFQVSVYLALSLTNLVFLGGLAPFSSRATNRVELLNELSVLLTGNLSLSLIGDGLYRTYAEQELMSTAITWVLLAYIGLNLIFVAGATVFGLKASCRLAYLKREHAKKMAQYKRSMLLSSSKINQFDVSIKPSAEQLQQIEEEGDGEQESSDQESKSESNANDGDASSRSAQSGSQPATQRGLLLNEQSVNPATPEGPDQNPSINKGPLNFDSIVEMKCVDPLDDPSGDDGEAPRARNQGLLIAPGGDDEEQRDYDGDEVDVNAVMASLGILGNTPDGPPSKPAVELTPIGEAAPDSKAELTIEPEDF